MAIWVFIYLAIGIVSGAVAWRDLDQALRGEGGSSFFVTDAEGEDITPKDNPAFFTGILLTVVLGSVLLWPLGIAIQLALNKKKKD